MGLSIRYGGLQFWFEKENTNTLYMPNEMILTFLMSQAQAESESMSSNIRWGHQARFKQGIVHYNFNNFLGYRKGADGEPEIDEAEAPTVRRIFARYLMGQSVGQICKDLTADGLKTARGSTDWSDHTVRHILLNEKYMGDAILQKTFTLDLFSRQQVKNEGQLPKYYVENAHPAIIDRATFQKVQEEMARRSSLRKTSSKAKTEQGKHSGKYALVETWGIVPFSETASPASRLRSIRRPACGFPTSRMAHGSGRGLLSGRPGAPTASFFKTRPRSSAGHGSRTSPIGAGTVMTSMPATMTVWPKALTNTSLSCWTDRTACCPRT